MLTLYQMKKTIYDLPLEIIDMIQSYLVVDAARASNLYSLKVSFNRLPGVNRLWRGRLIRMWLDMALLALDNAKSIIAKRKATVKTAGDWCKNDLLNNLLGSALRASYLRAEYTPAIEKLAASMTQFANMNDYVRVVAKSNLN